MQKILVIDDDPMIRYVLSQVLKKRGHEVHLASDSWKACRYSRTCNPIW
jgi:CheY-like chemotaxis protein